MPVQPEPALVERLRDELPELPGKRIVRLRDELGAATAQTLVTGGLDALWAATRDAGAEPVAAANVIANQLVGAGVDPSTRDRRSSSRSSSRRATRSRARRSTTRSRTPATRASAPIRTSSRRRSRTRRSSSRSSTRCSRRTQRQVEAYRGGKTGPARLLRRPGDEGGRTARPTRASSTSSSARSSTREDLRVRADARDHALRLARRDDRRCRARQRRGPREPVAARGRTAVVGAHPAACPQLFLVVAGSGWARSGDEPRSPVAAGEAALWEDEEVHESGSDRGLTAVIVEADAIEPLARPRL